MNTSFSEGELRSLRKASPSFCGLPSYGKPSEDNVHQLMNMLCGMCIFLNVLIILIIPGVQIVWKQD
jgi:hypothetical protein